MEPIPQAHSYLSISQKEAYPIHKFLHHEIDTAAYQVNSRLFEDTLYCDEIHVFCSIAVPYLDTLPTHQTLLQFLMKYLEIRLDHARLLKNSPWQYVASLENSIQ